MKLVHPNYQRIAQAIRRTETWDDASPLPFPEEGAEVYSLTFHSAQAKHLLGHHAYHCEEHGLSFEGEPARDGTPDCNIKENLDFRYPFLRALHRGSATKSKHLIVLLHGLNERSYSKYVPWAYQLWRNTGAAVALFPLSFHVNRVHPPWGRSLEAHLARRRQLTGNENVHPYNCVLSERLDARPERFFWGGVQSYGDVVDLVRTIRADRHPYVHPEAQVDVLGYSAGGYLALGLMLGDPGGLFSSSRCVLFESGAAMRANHLSTRLIMDLACEVALMKLYVRFTARLANPRLAHWLADHEEGRWFRALFGEERERARFEQRLKEVSSRLLAISNTNDDVIPSSAVFNTLRGKHRDTNVQVEELTLGVHEHPFVCSDYEQKDRRFVTEYLDVPALGEGFEKFIFSACQKFS
jgi:pimeloyl-ACP methyl ester carboxylesterase